MEATVATRRQRGKRSPEEYPVSNETRDIFRRVLLSMNGAKIPYVVGGAFALHQHSGFWRVAKDLDLFLPPRYVDRAMETLARAGFPSWRKHPEWLAQVIADQYQVDLIYGMGNWLQFVDEDYIRYAPTGKVLGVRCKIMAAEEVVYSKAFVAARDRYDAGDIFHVLATTARRLDWQRILKRFGEHWEVLLSHLIMFRYVYPSHRDDIPPEVMDELLARLEQTRREPWSDGKITRGFLLDPNGTYALDVREWGYRDARQEAWEELRRREGHPTDAGKSPGKATA